MFNTPMSRWMLAILCLLLGLLSGCIFVVHMMNWMQYGVHFGLPFFDWLIAMLLGFGFLASLGAAVSIICWEGGNYYK